MRISDWSSDVCASDLYGHLLLEQQAESDDTLLSALRPYFESAHLDAREHFHRKIGISLHPDSPATPNVTYPACLPTKALRGLFGEAMAGLVTEAYQNEFVGRSEEHTSELQSLKRTP